MSNKSKNQPKQKKRASWRRRGRTTAGRHPTAKSRFTAGQLRWFSEMKRAEKMLPHLDDVGIAALGAQAIQATVSEQHPNGELHLATSNLEAIVDEQVQLCAGLADLGEFRARKAAETKEREAAQSPEVK